MKQPKMPQLPPAPEQTPPPDRANADAAVAARAEDQRLQRGRRSTIIAGAAPAQPLGGANTVLGGNS